eukprot:gnl/Trimastix_PCT/213.p1 GENE.gnl/Trimastix_PCT/213~~gnl/Trimastix_PCT/213.p1  ORF type:complete len:933 (-),score=389.49 gnl/Trimastix_PCT/213:323-3121(-)
MSKFWADGSDSESEDDQRSLEEEPVEAGLGATKWLDFETDNTFQQRRVVQSHRDKFLDELKACYDRLKNCCKINDWNAIVTEFDKLNKAYAKYKRSTTNQGTATPQIYIRALYTLEESIKSTDAQGKKKFNRGVGRSFNTMKQRLRKNNEPFRDEIEAFRANPPPEEEEEESDSEDDSEFTESEDEAPQTTTTRTAAPAPAAANAGASRFFAGADSDSDEESDHHVGGNWADEDDDNVPSQWLRKDEDEDEGFTSQKTRKQRRKERQARDPAGHREAQPDKLIQEREKPQERTEEAIERQLLQIIANRGKKGTDRREQIDQLCALLEHVRNPAKLIEILVHVVAAQFDMNISLAAHLPIPVWKSCHANLARIIELFTAHHAEVRLVEHDASDPQDADASEMFSSQVATLPPLAPGEPRRVRTALWPFLERLHNEFVKSLQLIDPHTQDYVARMQDEGLIVSLCAAAQEYYIQARLPKLAARAAALRIEHLYYVPDAVPKPPAPTPAAEATESTEGETESTETPAAVPAAVPAAAPAEPERPVSAVVGELTAFVLRHCPDERVRTRTLLCRVYHLSLCDQYEAARDLVLMTRLQDTVTVGASTEDIPTQILFNRAMAQLGMAAFRAGCVPEAHNALSDLCGSNRVRELLAQGTAPGRYQDRTPEQEQIERRRILPYHMHINLELLECIHLVSAMLLEVPNTALNAADPRRKVISKPFRRLLHFVEHQTFTGPPESQRDFIVAGARAMVDGDWRQATELVLSIPAWALLPKCEEVKRLVARKIQEESLRTYVLYSAAFYDTLGVEALSTMFEMDRAAVHGLVSKMMACDEVLAAWDESSQYIVIGRAPPSRLHSLSIQLSEKLSLFVEANEKLLDSKSSGFRSEPGKKDHLWKDAWTGPRRAGPPMAATRGPASLPSGAQSQSRRMGPPAVRVR